MLFQRALVSSKLAAAGITSAQATNQSKKVGDPTANNFEVGKVEKLYDGGEVEFSQSYGRLFAD